MEDPQNTMSLWENISSESAYQGHKNRGSAILIDSNNIVEWTNQTIEELCDGLYERDETVAVTLLTVLSGQSVFLYGPPGTAKSLISRRISSVFSDSNYFEYLMQRFSTPEEVFGPVSIRELKNDNYLRITDNYLPTADIAFLDEIWKSSPAILNTLLTIINERKFKNGRVLEDAPLKALIAASNEFPAENSGLDALYDRFIVRLCVYPIKEEENFRRIVSNNNVPSFVRISSPISTSEWKSISVKANAVKIPDSIFDLLGLIRKRVDEHNKAENTRPIYISDRRWQKAMAVVKTASALSGRTFVDTVDLFILKHCLWSDLEDKAVIDGIIDSALSSFDPSTSAVFSEWVDRYCRLVDDTESLFREYGKRDTVTVSGKDCYQVNVSKPGFGSSNKNCYYIPVDQVSVGKSYYSLSNRGGGISYKVDSNDGTYAHIRIDGQVKMIPLAAGSGISDPHVLKASREAMEMLIHELNGMIQSTGPYIEQLRSGKASPFVAYSCSGNVISSMQSDLERMRK